jgi:uncharacterized Zn finger protein
VAAVMYGVGSRLDSKPELLFRLRAVNENDLVADIGKVLPMSKQGPAASKVLEADDMAALFGLDMGDVAEPVEVAAPPPAKKVAAIRKNSVTKLKSPARKDLTGKGTPAKKVARLAVVGASPKKPEPKPVEWWKVSTPKKIAKAPALETTRPNARKKALVAS